MQLKELKCPNCGAKLKANSNEKETGQITCPYCQTNFVIEDEYNAGYQYTKGALKASEEQFDAIYKKIRYNPVSKIITIIFICLFFFIFIISISTIVSINKNMQPNKIIDQDDDNQLPANRVAAEDFNFTFKGYNGTKNKFFIEGYLDTIVTNNKTNQDHQISVKFNNQETTNPDEIVSIKQSLLDNKEYELSMDYDTQGYFNKLTITE